MAIFSRGPHEYWLKPHFSKNEVAKSGGWSPDKELLLYVAHGMDHLSGADDADEAGYMRMRRRELRWLSNPKVMV